MLRFVNVATPLAVATVVVPDSVPPLGFAKIASVTLPVPVVTTLSDASRTATWTAGVIAAPAVALLGCPVNARCVGAPGATSNVPLRALVRPLDDAPSA